MLQLGINDLLLESSSALLKSWSTRVRNLVLSYPEWVLSAWLLAAAMLLFAWAEAAEGSCLCS